MRGITLANLTPTVSDCVTNTLDQSIWHACGAGSVIWAQYPAASLSYETIAFNSTTGQRADMNLWVRACGLERQVQAQR